MNPLRVGHDWFSCPSDSVFIVADYNDINEDMDAPHYECYIIKYIAMIIYDSMIAWPQSNIEK